MCAIKQQALLAAYCRGHLPQPLFQRSQSKAWEQLAGYMNSACNVTTVGDPMLLQPGNQSVNIYEIAVDALQMHHIRLFF